MRIKNLGSLFIVFLCLGFVYAEQISIELPDAFYLDDSKVPTVFLNKAFSFNVVVSGKEDIDGEVVVKGIKQFLQENVSCQQSSTNINGNVTVEETSKYKLTALKEGVFTIGPARVTHNGNVFQSDSAQVRVVRKTGKYEALAKKHQNENTEYFYELSCELQVDKKKVVVGEIVTADILIYIRGNVVGLDNIQIPKIPGFSIQEEKDLKKFQEIKNENVFVVIRKRLKLVPQTKGIYKIEPVRVVYRVRQKEKQQHRSSFFGDSFFSSMFSNPVKQEMESTNALTLNVDSLPPSNQHVDAVGAFNRFEVKIDKTEVDQNEPIRFIWEVEGNGNLDYITSPKLLLPIFFKSYESKAETKEDENDLQKKGIRRFEFVLQIGKAGESIIPAQEFTYFDTVVREYKTLRSKQIKINIRNVVGSEAQEIKHKKKKEEETGELERDINFIEEDACVSTTSKKQIPGWLFLLSLIFVPIFIYAKKIKQIFLKLYTSWNAKKEKTFDIYQKELKTIFDKEKHDELYRFFLKVAADVFDISSMHINEDLIEEYTTRQNWPKSKTKDLLIFLNQCAQVAFLKAEIINTQELLKKATYWLSIFEQLSEHSA